MDFGGTINNRKNRFDAKEYVEDLIDQHYNEVDDLNCSQDEAEVGQKSARMSTSRAAKKAGPTDEDRSMQKLSTRRGPERGERSVNAILQRDDEHYSAIHDKIEGIDGQLRRLKQLEDRSSMRATQLDMSQRPSFGNP